ncbi:uncharacterized protein TNCV_3838271 [Trichonephila clavipes]|nr:uncharacterized protein TNCV_3838271 [Trichonephila clavipes]
MAPHKPRKSSPIQDTDDEDMIECDMEEQIDTPKEKYDKYSLSKEYWKNETWRHEGFLQPLPRGILIGQRKGPLRGRVCDGRVACVVGAGSKERSPESGPRGRGTWFRMARRRGLAHIEKFSLALALDRARQHVMGVSPLSSFEESSGGYTWHVRKVWEFGDWRDPVGTGRNP